MKEPLPNHQVAIERNFELWQRKPLLQAIYRNFYQRIAEQLTTGSGLTVELGSGIGAIRGVIPHCILTEPQLSPWVDRAEDAYRLSFADGTLDNLILFDVFHHLRYPGLALAEFRRALRPGGRVVLFEPCVSLLGRVIYGLLHAEPLALRQPIEWLPDEFFAPDGADYYAAQGNAYRIFIQDEHATDLEGWKIRLRERTSALSYVASGGYSGPQLYPTILLPLMRSIDQFCDHFPAIFATRLLVVMERN